MLDKRDYFEDLDKNPNKYRDILIEERLNSQLGYVWSKNNPGLDRDNCLPSVNSYRYFKEMKEL